LSDIRGDSLNTPSSQRKYFAGPHSGNHAQFENQPFPERKYRLGQVHVFQSHNPNLCCGTTAWYEQFLRRIALQNANRNSVPKDLVHIPPYMTDRVLDESFVCCILQHLLQLPRPYIPNLNSLQLFNQEPADAFLCGSPGRVFPFFSKPRKEFQLDQLFDRRIQGNARYCRVDRG